MPSLCVLDILCLPLPIPLCPSAPALGPQRLICTGHQQGPFGFREGLAGGWEALVTDEDVGECSWICPLWVTVSFQWAQLLSGSPAELLEAPPLRTFAQDTSAPYYPHPRPKLLLLRPIWGQPSLLDISSF